ncbi:PEP-CTERM sorting domain-containing protein [Paraglaciecola sp.]|uniref:PEP-CTERM sorting domain-containing protein n=1 Tax=Paraglaciecola sp. TaxID=1920173 RepID=UPI003264EC50
MKPVIASMFVLVLLLRTLFANAETKVLFIGNSFTYGYGSSVKFYRPDYVTDLNNEKVGGVPALFKSFTKQAGFDYDVYLETKGGSDLNFHVHNKLEVIGKHPWDMVVMHGYSTLDRKKLGDPARLIESTKKMSLFLENLNPKVDVFLTSTWSRADLIYKPQSPWSGVSIAKMALDIRAGYDKAVTTSPVIKGVNAVGEAWTKAIVLNIADANPYDGVEFGKVNLWTWDSYHGSNYGYYLHALVVFGNLTGVDPRSLGPNECSGYELGMSQHEISMLQLAAFEQLSAERAMSGSPQIISKEVWPQSCV